MATLHGVSIQSAIKEKEKMTAEKRMMFLDWTTRFGPAVDLGGFRDYSSRHSQTLIIGAADRPCIVHVGHFFNSSVTRTRCSDRLPTFSSFFLFLVK